MAAIQRPKTEPDFAKGDGLIIAVAQDVTTNAVLMVAYMDKEAYEKTLETGEMYYRSRSRGLWHKGATSGHTQHVHSLVLDCDSDAVLAKVTSNGPACHTGTVSCFDAGRSSNDPTDKPAQTLPTSQIHQLAQVIESRTTITESNQTPSYTAKLLNDKNLRLKKLGEEITELVVALTEHDVNRATEEAGDVLYHMLVALRAEGIQLSDVEAVLANRSK